MKTHRITRSDINIDSRRARAYGGQCKHEENALPCLIDVRWRSRCLGRSSQEHTRTNTERVGANVYVLCVIRVCCLSIICIYYRNNTRCGQCAARSRKTLANSRKHGKCRGELYGLNFTRRLICRRTMRVRVAAAAAAGEAPALAAALEVLLSTRYGRRERACCMCHWNGRSHRVRWKAHTPAHCAINTLCVYPCPRQRTLRALSAACGLRTTRAQMRNLVFVWLCARAW